MVEIDGRGHPDPARPLPPFRTRRGLEETDRLARAVTRSGHRERIQRVGVYALPDAAELHVSAEQACERRVVQQRNRVVPGQATDHERQQPLQSLTEYADDIGSVDMMDVEVLPHLKHAAHRTMKIPRSRRQGRGIDGARRCSADDRERIGAAARQHFRDRLQDADLVCGACAAARQNQADLDWGRG